MTRRNDIEQEKYTTTIHTNGDVSANQRIHLLNNGTPNKEPDRGTEWNQNHCRYRVTLLQDQLDVLWCPVEEKNMKLKKIRWNGTR
jgi:hypothetical protein